jgi:hypothetical protein
MDTNVEVQCCIWVVVAATLQRIVRAQAGDVRRSGKAKFCTELDTTHRSMEQRNTNESSLTQTLMDK